MFKVQLEIKQPHGQLKSGVKNGKPWAIAEQEAAVFVEGADYPVVGLIQAKTTNLSVGNDGFVTCQTAWTKPGRYWAKVTVQADRFRRIEFRLNDRDLTPVVVQAPKDGKGG